jgi:succinate dehydrogenase/fumarate reductase flavoprotein subunit
MGTEIKILNDYTINYHCVNTLVIGSGVAALNAAINLHAMGQEDIFVISSKWSGGTSYNAGSDKQTYYKLSLSGEIPDSVSEMAKDLFDGKCMHGDIALCEAQGSIQAFMNLVNLGVRFPHDKYGSWAGYKTDHDERGRATSVGPYTSKKMFQSLSKEFSKRGIRSQTHYHCVTLLTDSKGLNVIGAIAINTLEKDVSRAFIMFNATNIVLGTGGPAGIYETSVYPLSQNGSTGMALRAGATGQNLTESQFGIASTKFRWNLSGSYQQAIPRYFSTDKNGKDERQFLNDFFPDLKTLTSAIFLKGYQWPFDPGKVSNYGSSLIDILVHNEVSERGRTVYIDFTRNPSWGKDETFSPEKLDFEAKNYLKRSGALLKTPIERLDALNAPAIALYKDHKIDLAAEPLQIAVCAQHNNGGLKAGIWWESDLRHLFPVGEVNGSHGVYRPGGSALNSGQVGSYRAAQYISSKYKTPPPDIKEFLTEARPQISETFLLASDWMSAGKTTPNSKYLRQIRKRMSTAGGIIRNLEDVSKASSDAAVLLKDLPGKIGAGSVVQLAQAFQLLDNCITHFVYLEAIRTYLEKGGRSRGSYIVTDKEKLTVSGKTGSYMCPEQCVYDRDVENNILEVKYKNGEVVSNLVNVRDIPKQDLWFEKVWKDYLEDNYPDC